MKIGIIGSGDIGGSLGRLWAKAGHEVFFASRNPGDLEQLARQAGDNAAFGTVEEAHGFSELLLEAIPYHAAMKLEPRAYAGKMLISASNYYPERDGEIDLGGGLSQTEALAARLPDTRVVKAFNMMYAQEMAARADGETDERLAILYAGDDAEARKAAAGLIEDALFAPVNAGALANGRWFEHRGPLYGERMTGEEAKARLQREMEGAA